MKLLIENLNSEAVFIAPEIEYSGNFAAALDENGNTILILGDMTPQKSRIATITETPSDFCGRNYIYSDGALIKKTEAGSN